MAKKKTHQIGDIGDAMSYCHKNNILVYPVKSSVEFGKFQIENTLKNGGKKLWKKTITAKEINLAMSKTYKYYYDKSKN